MGARHGGVALAVLASILLSWDVGMVDSQIVSDDDGDFIIQSSIPTTQAQCAPVDGPCSLRYISCPVQCPNLNAVVSADRFSCKVNCRRDCNAVCKHRKLNCSGYSAICYDPRFVGGDGAGFHFHGKKDKDFCLVSDRRFHTNGHFIGQKPDGRQRDFTWVQRLGFLFDSDALTIGATLVSTWIEGRDQLDFTYNGIPFTVSSGESSEWRTGGATVTRTEDVNSVLLVIDLLLENLITVVPVTEKDSKLHNYQIPKDNCFAHLHMQFFFFNLSSTVNGVLGQTYASGYKSLTSTSGSKNLPVMRREDNYFSTSLLSNDCKVSQYQNPNLGHDVSDSLIKLSSSGSRIKCKSGGKAGFVCRR